MQKSQTDNFEDAVRRDMDRLESKRKKGEAVTSNDFNFESGREAVRRLARKDNYFAGIKVPEKREGTVVTRADGVVSATSRKK